MRSIAVLALAALLVSSPVHAEVRTDDKTQVKFEGVLGRMINFFNRGAKDGIVSTVSVKGDRKATITRDSSEIVDLKEEKVYTVDLRDKSYKVVTFAEMRQRMEEARKKAAAEQKPDADEKPQADRSNEKQVEIDFSLKESGQRRVINGFDAREVVMIITVREKGKTLEQSGGLVMTTNNWLAPKIPAMAEVADFDRRYAEQMLAPVMLDAQQAAAVMAMYPMMADAVKRMNAENVKLDGTSVLTEMKVEAVSSAEQAAQQTKSAEPESKPTGVSGLGGLIARRAMRGREKEEAPGTPGRATFMTVQHELLKVTPAVADADVTVPATFKLKN